MNRQIDTKSTKVDTRELTTDDSDVTQIHTRI